MLFNILQGLGKSSASRDIRYYLNAVRVVSNECGDIIMEATDGCSGVRITGCAWNENVNGDVIDTEDGTDVLLCRTSLLKVLKMFNAKTKLILKVSNNRATLNDVEVTLVDGRFPDLSRIIDGKNPYAAVDVGVNAVLLSKLMSNLNLCMNKPKFPTLRLKAQGAELPLKWTGDVRLDDGKSLTLDAVLMPARL